MVKKLLVLCGVMFFLVSMSYAVQPQKTISVLTCNPGEELYSVFGHSALMVTDKQTEQNVIYNFGVFDSETPFFYLKFIHGSLNYSLDSETKNWFMYVNAQEQRQVFVQELKLTVEQVDLIISKLDTLMLPENKFYKYRFAKRNCTTAIRDLVLDNVEYEDSLLMESTGQTYRDYIRDYIKEYPWVKLGINFLIGPKFDQEINVYESMFMPDILMNNLTLVDTDSGRLASPAQKLNHFPVAEKQNGDIDYYIMYAIFSLLVVVALLNRSRYCASVFFYIIGIFGVFLLFVMLISEHYELTTNFNVLWCNALFLLLGIVAGCRKPRFKLFMVTSGVVVACICAMIIIWLTEVQYFEPVFGLLVLASLLFIFRTARVLYRNYKNEKRI